MAKPNMPKATRPRDRTGFQLRSPRCPPVCVRPSHIHTHFAAAWTSARRKFFLSTLRDQHGRSPCPDWPPSFLSVLGGQGSRPEPPCLRTLSRAWLTGACHEPGKASRSDRTVAARAGVRALTVSSALGCQPLLAHSTIQQSRAGAAGAGSGPGARELGSKPGSASPAGCPRPNDCPSLTGRFFIRATG